VYLCTKYLPWFELGVASEALRSQSGARSRESSQRCLP
jgi:hypothetical protein